jgi:predicted amidophosphoribosyltransferase
VAETWLAGYIPHLCCSCGRDLTANTSGVCPECGREIEQKPVDNVE